MNITIRLTKVEYEMLKELQKKDKLRLQPTAEELATSPREAVSSEETNLVFNGIDNHTNCRPIQVPPGRDLAYMLKDANLLKHFNARITSASEST